MKIRWGWHVCIFISLNTFLHYPMQRSMKWTKTKTLLLHRWWLLIQALSARAMKRSHHWKISFLEKDRQRKFKTKTKKTRSLLRATAVTPPPFHWNANVKRQNVSSSTANAFTAEQYAQTNADALIAKTHLSMTSIVYNIWPRCWKGIRMHLKKKTFFLRRVGKTKAGVLAWVVSE